MDFFTRQKLELVYTETSGKWTVSEDVFTQEQALNWFNSSLREAKNGASAANPSLKLAIFATFETIAGFQKYAAKNAQMGHIMPDFLQREDIEEVRELPLQLGVRQETLKDAVTFAKYPASLGDPVFLDHCQYDQSRVVLRHSYRIAAADFVLAWAYFPNSATTMAIITFRGRQGRRITNRLTRNVMAHQTLAAHPMLLAVLALAEIAPEIEEWLDVHSSGVIKAAKDTGFHHNLNIGPDSGPQLHEIDLLRESKVASGVAANIATNKHCWEGLRDLATFICQECDDLLASVAPVTVVTAPTAQTSPNPLQSPQPESQPQPPQPLQPPRWITDHSTTYIKSHARHWFIKSNSFCQEAESWQQKATVQVQGLFNLIAQRDQNTNIEIADEMRQLAEEAKKDSTSMKAIAVVTMLFLPGSFAAVSLLFSLEI